MLTRLAAMAEDVGVDAARFLQGVGKDGQAVECPVVVDGLSQGNYLVREPAGVESNRVEGVAENVTEVASPIPQNNVVGIVEQREVTCNGRAGFRCRCREHGRM